MKGWDINFINPSFNDAMLDADKQRQILLAGKFDTDQSLHRNKIQVILVRF